MSDRARKARAAAWGTLRESLRERVRFLSFAQAEESELMAQADVVVCASEGAAPAPMYLLRALAHGAVPVASRLPVYEEVLGEGERGLLFEPGDAHTLAAQLQRLSVDVPPCARGWPRAARPRRERTWARTARALEDPLRGGGVAPPPSSGGHAALRRTLARRPIIDVDLHMHTDHSPDCATPVEVLLATPPSAGSGAIAVTDHNEISGALAAREQAAAAGVKVIVGEEVKTSGQGEVIGLFIEEKIARGMTLAETVAEIKRQGGLVYVPHPFDRLHAVPDYEHLLPILGDVDAIEVFNPRVAIDTFNEEAVRFAAKYNITAARAPTRTCPRGSAPCACACTTSTARTSSWNRYATPTSSRDPTSLLYVQALKFLQTRPRPAAGARARRVACAGAPIVSVAGRELPMHGQGQAGAVKASRGPCPPPTTRSARSTSSARSAS